jgi:DNA ligase (NAD+)
MTSGGTNVDKTQRIKELTGQLNKASYEYYNTGYPIMEDYEFDILLDELQKLENETGMVMADSPTINAGSRVAKEQKKIIHQHPMLSLDKIHSVDEIKKFIGNKDVIASMKMDGLTISLTYINGDLRRLESRGNGEIGTDLMIHKNSIKGVPLHIKHNGRYVIDGECIVEYDVFQTINDKLPDGEKFSNPRNMASGSLNLLDSKISATRGLTFMAWNVIEDSEDFKPIMLENFTRASGLGFDIVPFIKIDDTDEANLENVLATMKHISNSRSLPMDGVVFSYNNIAYGKSLGMTSHHMRHSIAYKYYDEEVTTTLRDIIYDVSKNGILTPVAIFKPVEIEGTTVERASLSNLSILQKTLGEKPFVGQEIAVTKRNCIIPKIEKAKDENGEWI